MKSSVPADIFGSDLLRRGYIRNVPPHQIAPVLKVGIPHSLRVLTLQRNDMRPDRALVICRLFRNSIQHQRFIRFRKQSVRIRTGIQVVHKYLTVKLAVIILLRNRLFHTVAGRDIFYIIPEPFVRVRLDVAAGDD